MTGIFASKQQSSAPQSPLVKESFWYHNRYVILSFFVPFILMVYGFFCSDFSPFGDNQILVIDMWHQYFPFFNELQDKLTSFGSLFYSWSGALGTNFISLIAYYAASPLNLISILFPKEYLVECMALIVALKIAFAGAFMCIFLRSMFKRCDISTVTFSMLYALCAYSLGYYWCLMWLDCLALLPLCMLGLNKLIDEGKFRLYVVTLAMMLLTNYYIGVMMCIFIMCYYPILYFQRVKAKGAKVCAITTAKAVLFSGVAIMIAAVLLVPTYLNMQNSYYMDKPMPTENSFYNPIMNVFSNLLPQVKLTVRGGLPNIYCGLISAMMAVMFLLCKKIPAKKRILNCVILCFLVLSFNWNKLDFIWHGFHFPNELPYRYSFVFSFILVTMAYEAFIHLKDITPAQIGGTVAGGFIYIALQQMINADNFDYKVIYISLLFLGLYAAALAVYKCGKFKEIAACVLVFIIAFGEMALYTEESVVAVGNSNKVTYYSDYENIKYVLDKTETNDPGFYRIEMNEPWTCNPGALYGFRGVSQFSSEINSNVSYMMKYIGVASDPGSNSFIYRTSSPVTNAMLGVKYIFGKSSTVKDSALELMYTQGSTYMYKNKYALSVGYGATKQINSWNYQSGNPIDVQESWIEAVTGTRYNVYDKFADPVISGSNVVVGGMNDGRLSLSPENQTGGSTVSLTYTSDKQQTLYAYIQTNNAQSISATTSSGYTTGFELNRGAISSLGELQAGESVTITVNYEENKACDLTCDVRTINQQNWDNAYAAIADEQLDINEYSDAYLKGDIAMKQDGVLMTSIPYSKGWSVKVDGVKTDVKPIGDALITVLLSAGAHTVEFSYMPDGFIIGLLITLLGIALLVLLYYVDKNRDKIIAILKNKPLPVAVGDNSAEDTVDIGVDATDEELPLAETDGAAEETQHPIEDKAVSAEPDSENVGAALPRIPELERPYSFSESVCEEEKPSEVQPPVESFDGKTETEASGEDVSDIMDEVFPEDRF